MTGEIVIAYAGTQFGGSGAGQAGDWLAGNLPLAAGLLGPQAVAAAELYQRVAADLGKTVTFTGHSLGGGLAAMMAVYFDQAAKVFAPAPFGKSADPTQYALGALGPLAAIRAKLFANALLDPHLGGIPEALADFSPGGDYTARSAKVQAWAVKGEILEKTLFLLPFIETSGTRTSLFTAGETELGMTAKHSIDLHAAGLMSPTFNKWAATLPGALPLIFDRNFYAVDLITGTEQDFLVKLNRNQIGVTDTAPNAMLSHFANDLQKLGTNMAGLSRAAQDALTAQSIEWYFWQGNDYAGQEFFNQTGELLQYTSAQAAGLANVQNKAVNYVGKWLTAVTDENGAPVGDVTYDQWNVVAGSSGATATAKDANKGQIFIGGAGGDTFTGGNKGDVFYASAGDDSLNGGTGDNANDWLYGGAGNDTYKFTGTFGSDVVIDSDGQGSIEVDGVTLQGGKKLDDNSWYNKEQGFVFVLLGSGDNKTLVIQKDSSLNYIRVQGWQNGQLGLTMEGTLAETPEVAHIFTGDQHGQLVDDPGTGHPRYDWNSTTWAADGTLAGGVVEAGYRDVIIGSNGNDKISGLGGNDALVGGGGNDEIDGGDGNDLIGGGAGSDTIHGGAGNDTILSASGLNVFQRNSPTADWEPTLAQNGGSLVYDDAPDVIDAGAGNDTVYAGRGNDRIDGGAGVDVLYGGAGNDIVEGGADDDTLVGDGTNVPNTYGSVAGADHGNDFLDGGDGNDGLIGGGKDDTLFGGAGNDLMHGDDVEAQLAGEFHGNDYLDGEGGDDRMAGGGKDDILYGGSGNDMLNGDNTQDLLAGEFHGNDYLDGQEGDDLLAGSGKDDVLYGGTGNDVLLGDDTESNLAGAFHGNDYLDGGDGDDVLRGGGGNDTLYGGSGNDTLNGDDEPENLAAEFHGNDYLDGGDGDDVLKGGGGNDTLYGGKGNDTLIGGAGADLLDGGEGNDSYEAGAGDTVSDTSGTNTLKLADSGPYTVSTSGADLVLNYGDSGNLRITGALGGSIASIDGVALGDWLQNHLSEDASLQSTGENQVLTGGSGNDELSAQHSGVTLRGGNGNDLLTGWAGNATLNGGDGNDVLDASGAANVLTGDAGNDRLTAAGGDDTLDGGVGNDILSGGAGSDTLRGGAGDDVIDGGDGDDRLSGGSGIDILRGGNGLDTYVLGYGMGQATLEDHSPEGSVIELDASGLQLESLTARRVNNDLEVGVRGTDTRMLVKDYYGATQTSLLFKDPQGNTLSVQALVDASTPQWVNLQGSLIETAKAEARSRIGAEYSAQGYARQADGGWYIADALRLLDNNSYEYVTTTTYTHQLMSNSSTTWTTPSTSVAGTQWAFSDGDWVDYASRSDTAVAVSDQSQTVSDEFISLASMSGSVSYQQIWRGVAWSVRSSEAGTTTSPRIQYVRSEPGSPPEIITEESSSTYLTRFYSGLDTGITLEDPGAAATAGPLPAYVSGVFAHRQWNYQLGQVTLSDGNHTVMADGYSSVIGGVGDNIIYNAGFAYGGTGNAILSGGNTLMAGSGDQYLEYGKTMVVGDGHDTVLARAYRRFELYYGTSTPRETVRILVDPNNTGMDLLLSEHELSNGGLDQNRNGLDDVIESIYQEQGFSYGSKIQYSYQHGGKFYWGGGFFDTLEAARNAYYEQQQGTTNSQEWSDEFASYIKPLPALFRNPGFADVLQSWGPASDYYDSHPLQTILLTANNFAVLQPYLEAGLLPLKTVVFGPGLSLADIGLSWGVAVSPLDGEARVTLKLQWGPDQGVQVMIPRTDDVLNAAIQKFEFADGSTVWLQDLIAMAPPAPDFDLGYAQLHAGMGAQSADAADVTGIRALVASASELKVESDGVDLVISIIGSSDSLRITGWYADPNAMSRAILFTSGNTALSAAELTDRGLIKDGSAGGMDLHGIPGFATTFIAGPNTRMTGNSGMDVYVYNPGSGEVHITDPGGGAVRFGSGVSATATLGLGDGSLLVKLGNQGDKIYLENFDPSNAGNFQSVWNFEFAGGSTLNLQDLLNQGFDLSGTSGADTINGTSVTDRILAGAGDDVLRGGRGDDTLDGGAGSDTYLWSRGDGDDDINEVGDSGTETDTVKLLGVKSHEMRLGRDTTNLYLNIGTEQIEIANHFSNPHSSLEKVQFSDGRTWNKGTLDTAPYRGTDGPDVLVGSTGAEQLMGLAGDDSYIVDNIRDVVDEEANEGIDTVTSSVDYTIRANIENLILAGSALEGTGNALDNMLIGNREANRLTGGFGADTLIGGDGDDMLDGAATNDVSTVEMMVTSDSSAVYYVYGSPTISLTMENCIVPGVMPGGSVRFQGGISSSINIYVTPGSHVDLGNVDINTGSVHLSGKFSDYSQTVDQNTGILSFSRELAGGQNERLDIKASDLDSRLYFADAYFVLNSNDSRLVSTASDLNPWEWNMNPWDYGNFYPFQETRVFEPIQEAWLTTGEQAWPLDIPMITQGADRLVGGLGNDLYFLDDAGDTVVENAEEGTDTVQSHLANYTLGAHVENLTLLGSGNINGTGNALANVLVGNAGNNTLAGDRGGDTYQAYRGMGQDRIVENDATPGTIDVLSFSTEISANQLWMRRSGNDLEINIIGTADKATVQDWYLGDAHHVEQISLSDGKVLLDSDLEILVQAMAPYTPPAMGQTDLSAAYAAQLAPVIAASWH
ncbi:calcium-binding protein [Polaromonas sp. CT11-55]|uniref:calcium-binding protein n=1 Tax=Polaromonas sp. CT11-55 TaxID=3243045 RepID=UPI0039A6C6C2